MGLALLVEIGVEELPAVPLLRIEKKIEKSWRDILREKSFESDFEFLYTPRRLVLRHECIPEVQPDITEELVGPPLDIALKDGEPTAAGMGFAKKCGVDFEELGRIVKGNRECLHFKREIPGRRIEELLPEMVEEWISSMNFGKMMRWGERKEEFIRPVRWLQLRVGELSVDMELFGVRSWTKSYLHRMVSSEAVEIENISDYEKILEDGKVILSPSARRERIVSQIAEIEAQTALKVELDEELLSEITAITEYPTALMGSFDEAFLELPPEVIIVSMKEHQRYFPVFDRKGGLAPRFVVVSNAVTEDFSKVIPGNERVLRPRLSDALFFYRNDLRRGLHTDGLEKIQFIDGLGTLADKIERERNIALRLAGIYMDRLEEESGRSALEIEKLMERAVTLAKADLLSEMVYEFTELQGLMGYYYAKALGEDPLVYNAIAQQYRPEGENAELPESLFSSILALSIKLDTLMGLFSVGKIPTGSKDPFALRRAVNGIIRIVLKYDIPFEIGTILSLMRDQYDELDIEMVEKFIIERIYKSFDANPSVISAVLSSGERDINEIAKKVSSLNDIVTTDSFKEIFTTFKRVANISSDVDITKELHIDESLLKEEEERRLYLEFRRIEDEEYADYKERLQRLFSLKDTLDAFFDNVLVNSEDEKLRGNRRNLVASIYRAFREIADIKEISV